ncbi:iron(III) dicitrate transport system, permease protein FecD, partial [Pseudomonas syringae pv. actinidiae ICMP 19079]
MLLALYNTGVQFSGVRFALSGVAIAVTLSSITEFLILSNPLDINTLAKPLNLIGLGDEAAQSLGTSLKRIRWLAMGSAVLLTSLG